MKSTVILALFSVIAPGTCFLFVEAKSFTTVNIFRSVQTARRGKGVNINRTLFKNVGPYYCYYRPPAVFNMSSRVQNYKKSFEINFTTESRAYDHDFHCSKK